MSLALFANKSPKLLHVHGPMSPPASPFGDRCIWNAFRYIMRGHVCVSRDMENMLLNAKWAAPDRTFTIYNAVDCSHWAVRRDKARAALGLPKDTVILGMICRLVADKGCSDGVRLLRRLPEQFHLAIAGEGPEKSNIVKLAAANGLSHRVHLLGLLDDARLAYSSVDNLLFLSRKEPFGLLLAEAMAAGVPIVGLSGQGGYREKDYPLVTRETAALLDRPDPEDTVTPTSDLLLDHLATTIQGLNASPESRDAMAHRAQTWVRERFGGERYAGLMAGLYRKLLREE
jgi:glycosyltransferase involved in cell wall biosynthesis